MLVRREGDLSRLEATASTSQADTLKRDVELSNREQALASQLAKVKAAEAQLQSKQLEAKELQVGLSQQHCTAQWSPPCCLNKLQCYTSTGTSSRHVHCHKLHHVRIMMCVYKWSEPTHLEQAKQTTLQVMLLQQALFP